MKPFLPALILGLGLSTAVVSPAAAYPVDCAILLCLSGGWPASTECAHARAVFIRRITPWPIEPPLQIWNCPMRAKFPIKARTQDRLFDIAFRDRLAPPAMSFPKLSLEPTHVGAQADVDISDPAFDFVRSIRVFEITYMQRRTHDGDCSSSSVIYAGTYGAQGDYTRRRSSLASVPAASDLNPPADCQNYTHRSVFVDWRDFAGSYGHEEVHY